MIPNGDLGKGFGLRASLELDKHPEGPRSEVVGARARASQAESPGEMRFKLKIFRKSMTHMPNSNPGRWNSPLFHRNCAYRLA